MNFDTSNGPVKLEFEIVFRKDGVESAHPFVFEVDQKSIDSLCAKGLDRNKAVPFMLSEVIRRAFTESDEMVAAMVNDVLKRLP